MNETFEPNEGSLTWSDAHLLGYDPMDEMHKEFYSIARTLLTCGSSNVLEAIAIFERHLVEHFEQEERWMVETSFPSRNCHIEEHAAVLNSVRRVRQTMAAGDLNINLAHDLAYHLLRWFPGHTDYLDSTLASWLTRIKHEGTPIGLRCREFTWFGP
jgi:hemerythrin